MFLVPGSTGITLLVEVSARSPCGENAVDPDRAPIVVVGRISVVLRIETRIESGKQSRAVLALPNILRGVIEAAVTDQEIQATAGKI